MAQGGGKIELVFEGTVLDSLCWGTGEACYEAFNAKHPTTLVRKIVPNNEEPSTGSESAFNTTTETNVEPEVGTGTESETNTESEIETEAESEAEPETEPKVEVEANTEPVIKPEAGQSEQQTQNIFVHDETYRPNYDPGRPGLVIREAEPELENLGSDKKKEPPGPESNDTEEHEETNIDKTIELEVGRQCEGVEFSEILTYYTEAADEQFIELFNRNDGTVQLDQCLLRYKKKDYPLKGELRANSYLAIYPQAEWGLKLTKNPTSTNRLELVSLA